MRLASLVAASLSLLPLALSQVVQWDFSHHKHVPSGLPRRSARAFEAGIDNRIIRGGYFADVKIGSPAQCLTLQIDTASSDTWMPWTEASVCSHDGGDPCTLGSFDPDDSETLKKVGAGSFELIYVDNSYCRGDYIADTFHMGGTTVKNLTMGLATDTSVPYGILGLGYPLNEASTDISNVTYPNLPAALERDGLINTIAYSLWLNDLAASTGNILFGAIDTEKFVGGLTRIGVLSQSSKDDYIHFVVALTSLVASSPSGSDILTSVDLPISAVLDSGSTLTYLPHYMARQTWEQVGAVWDPTESLAVIPCSAAHAAGRFSFGFAGADGPMIDVLMDELVIDLTDGDPPRFDFGRHKGEPMCVFGIQNQTSAPYVLGNTFLRSAYVVYDLVNNEIGLAMTDFNSTKANIVTFPSHGAAIPSATMAPNQDAISNVIKPTETFLDAAAGFQELFDDEEDAASSVRCVSSLGLMIVGSSVLYMLRVSL
jgi:hypothetical protein